MAKCEDTEVLKTEIHDRLLARCEVDALTRCWIYTYCWGTGEAGKVSVQGRTYSVARVSAWLYLGQPAELHGPEFVYHRRCCNAPACFNPGHLAVAPTRSDGIRALRRLGRWGNDQGGHKLTQASADRLRLQATTMNLTALEAEYSIRPAAIRAVRDYRTYASEARLGGDISTLTGGSLRC